MHTVFEELGNIGIVPVITIDDEAQAVPLAQALMAGGIPCAEITFRTAQAAEAIRRIKAAVPGILVGAGTVLSIAQADKAIRAGAQFIVSPGFNPQVVSHCAERGIPISPGCTSPSDLERAVEFGLEVVKFFPAEASGGLDYIKAVAAPFPGLKFMPTGGIHGGNLAAYLAYEKILACGGSWMAGADSIRQGDFPGITARCKEALHQALGFSVVHWGINTENPGEASQAAQRFSTLFGFSCKESQGSIFAGPALEVMKARGWGTHGHIALGTHSVPRAIAYLERQGIRFKQDSIQRDATGAIRLIYLEEVIAGFALHLVPNTKL
ncbi:MAG: bifunctional 4-hydroxy-2-oxoglutarate aldolase/2-dehydro-3-deoxy-phosphogluconate aldolase [Treponema sp.]|jgi:2-dehydro-3-deoxyphosphogluconate aldolase/(4S)-4-hydroxy-2-oxoglutarate aldolase|nr:bifunctional 4-hydroxy-2-oxoglutarate aldolase/2-dehydro-3-deoxy-phosphogluconate aldolase [Treponema sp.]